MIYGIKSTVENLHSKHISKALKESQIAFVYVSVGEEPDSGCDVFLDQKDDGIFIYIKTEDAMDQEVLKNTVANALTNYNPEDYYPA